MDAWTRDAPEGRGRERANPWRAIPEAAWSVACDFEHPNPARPDHDKPEIVDPPYAGAPFGGFGAGTFARTYRGDFARWHLHTGHHAFRSLPACAHALAVHVGGTARDAFALGPEPTDGSLSAWVFRRSGVRYAALYPLSWYEGSAAAGAVLWRLTQFSPVLPNSYRESSFPIAIFRWHLRNTLAKPVTASVLFSWENVSIVTPGEIVPSLRAAHRLGPVETPVLWMGRVGVPPRSDEDGAFALAAEGGRAVCEPFFDPAGAGEAVWRHLIENDWPDVPKDGRQIQQGPGRAAGAIGATVDIEPGETREAAFALAWHFPIFRFGSGRGWYRRYTHFYSRAAGSGDAEDPAIEMAVAGLRMRDRWQQAIEEWQEPILQRRPPAFARALFNGLYILADGGCAWENGEVEEGSDEVTHAPVPFVPGSRDVGRFAVLECFTYPYYATLDVRFYASFPLLFFWPELERQVLLQFAMAAGTSDAEDRQLVHVEERAPRKRPGVLPHDLGTPGEDPWVKTNAYDDIDPNRWKDLGPKFVLQVARYLSRIGWEDRGFLHGVWPAVKSALSHAEQQDTNGDGLPDNEGIPDQTFDKWPMTGASAYCGGLTVAALVAAREIAEWCGDPGAGKHYDAWCRKAARSLHDALWSGDGFRYDTAPENASLVMAAQLAGEWALAMAGLPGYVEAGTVRRTLESIWQHCACRVEGSLWGLVNGAPLPGSSAPDNRHAREVWTGINYAVASHMILAGMQREAMELIEALSRVTYEDRPFAFRVPEAWDEKGNFRGTLYMRPLAVWAVEEALRRARPDPRLSSFLQTPEG